MIIINNYQQLKLLCWNIHSKTIDEKTALYLYETSWRFVDKKNLTNDEILLIEMLIKNYGNGVFFT